MSKDLSLSFLNTDSSIQSKQSASTDNQRSNAFRELFDPVFVNLRVMIPRKIEKIFKGVDRIDFMYDFIDSNYIEIVEMQSGNTFFRIFTCDYEHFPFKDKNELTNELEAVNGTATNRMGIVFVFGREKFRNACKMEQNRKYKESINKNVRFTEDSILKELKMKYLEYQIENHINFIFIEDSQFLHSQLRSLISLRKEKDRYTPKTRKFCEYQKREFLKNILETIPGVSQNISNAILGKYSDVSSVVKGLLNKELFMSIKVIDENGGLRDMPEKVYLKLYNTFYSNDGDEKI